MIKLNGENRTDYIIICQAIESLRRLSESGNMKDAGPYNKRLKTAATNMEYFRDKFPFEVNNNTKRRLIEDIKSLKIELRYKGSNSTIVNADELKDLLEFTVESKCVNCYKTPIEIKKCRFKKRWWSLLDENDVESRSCSCEYSCLVGE